MAVTFLDYAITKKLDAFRLCIRSHLKFQLTQSHIYLSEKWE